MQSSDKKRKNLRMPPVLDHSERLCSVLDVCDSGAGVAV